MRTTSLENNLPVAFLLLSGLLASTTNAINDTPAFCGERQYVVSIETDAANQLVIQCGGAAPPQQTRVLRPDPDNVICESNMEAFPFSALVCTQSAALDDFFAVQFLCEEVLTVQVSSSGSSVQSNAVYFLMVGSTDGEDILRAKNFIPAAGAANPLSYTFQHGSGIFNDDGSLICPPGDLQTL